MTKMALVMAGALLSACGGGRHFNPQAGASQISEADRLAWNGAPIIELERHPLFSVMHRDARRLSDGSETWDFAACETTEADVQCRSWSYSSKLTDTSCADHGSRKFCCHNLFILRDGRVEEYRPTGSCRTGCFTRPGGVCRDITTAAPSPSASSTAPELSVPASPY